MACLQINLARIFSEMVWLSSCRGSRDSRIIIVGIRLKESESVRKVCQIIDDSIGKLVSLERLMSPRHIGMRCIEYQLEHVSSSLDRGELRFVKMLLSCEAGNDPALCGTATCCYLGSRTCVYVGTHTYTCTHTEHARRTHADTLLYIKLIIVEKYILKTIMSNFLFDILHNDIILGYPRYRHPHTWRAEDREGERERERGS